MAGYSTTPLVKKLGYQPGLRVHLIDAPPDYLELVAPLPEDVVFRPSLREKVDLVHLFTTRAEELAGHLLLCRRGIEANGAIWVSWPKKAARVPTDVTEDVIRTLALPLGLVDVKVCAVDAIWSALKLVIRVEDRDA